MIAGTGVDLAEVDRIREAIARFGDRFIHRIYTEREIAYVQRKANRYERYAARFAAKEAGNESARHRLAAWNPMERFRGCESSIRTAHFATCMEKLRKSRAT